MTTKTSEIFFDEKTSPENRANFALAVHRHSLYLYGGDCACSGQGLADFYEYNPAEEQWTRLSKNSSPGRLIGGTLVDTSNNLFLFGGEICERVGECPFWKVTLPNGDFTKLTPRGANPSNRKHSSMIFAKTWTEDAIFMFGGHRHLVGDVDELWSYSPQLEKWRKLPSGPAPRSNAGITYYQQNIIIVGGSDRCDIWGYHTSLGFWTEWMKNIPRAINGHVTLVDDIVYSVSSSKLGSFLYKIDLQDRKYSFTTHCIEKTAGSQSITIGKTYSEFRTRSCPNSTRKTNPKPPRNRSQVGVYNDGFKLSDHNGISLNQVRSISPESNVATYNSFDQSSAPKSPDSVDSAYSSSPEVYRHSVMSLPGKTSTPVMRFSKPQTTEHFILVLGGKPIQPFFTKAPITASKIYVLNPEPP